MESSTFGVEIVVLAKEFGLLETEHITLMNIAATVIWKKPRKNPTKWESTMEESHAIKIQNFKPTLNMWMSL